jgi:hypothetical protein
MIISGKNEKSVSWSWIKLVLMKGLLNSVQGPLLIKMGMPHVAWQECLRCMFPPPVNSRTITHAYESKLDEKWNILFMELVEYKGKNGHCDVPQRNNGSLGSWIMYQRLLFRSKKLKADRYEKLVGIGFVFEDVGFASDNEKWNRHFVELVKYKQKNGHGNVPRRNGSFGAWVSNQKTLFRSKKLKEDRYEKLVGIGFAEDVEKPEQ